jgi:hypothetical protein
MEIWGKLPLNIDGQLFDKEAIKAERLVLQIKPIELPGHAPRIQLFPLLESNPGRARLRFPEDVFRPGEQLQFIDTDHNHPAPRHATEADHAHPADRLSETFSAALSEAGFRFPVHASFGRVSILKPFDAGYFLLDANDALFHLKRVDGKPWVAPVPLPDDLKVKHLKITENNRKEIIGLLLDDNDQLHLIRQEDYRLIPLELPDYEPHRMELKIIFNPMYRTAIYSDQEMIHAVVMDREFQAIEYYSRIMAMAGTRLVDQIWAVLVPFSINLKDPDRRYFHFNANVHGLNAIGGNILFLIMAIGYLSWRKQTPGKHVTELSIVLLTGLYGLIALVLIPPDRERI